MAKKPRTKPVIETIEDTPETPKITTKIEKITIEKAKLIMKDQEGMNRPLSKGKVRGIAADLIDGRYVLNGESIVFDQNGILLDGQHRIAGLIEAAAKGFDGCLESVVVRGVPREMFSTFDQGEKRTLKDIVAMDLDSEEYADIAVALRFFALRFGNGNKASKGGKLPHHQAMKMLADHPYLPGWVEYVVELKADSADMNWLPMRHLVTPGYLGALCYIASMNYNTPDIEQFCKDLIDQDNTKAGCPAHALRKVLLKNRASKDAKFKRDAIIAYVTKAMIAYLEKEEVLNLKLKTNEYPLFPSEIPDDQPEDEEVSPEE